METHSIASLVDSLLCNEYNYLERHFQTSCIRNLKLLAQSSKIIVMTIILLRICIYVHVMTIRVSL